MGGTPICFTSQIVEVSYVAGTQLLKLARGRLLESGGVLEYEAQIPQ